jgi:hypothetical protein
MQRFRERFRAAPQTRDYFAFLKATDGLLHAQGPARLDVALESLDKILREIQAHCGDDTEIVMFSDHGMNLEENRRVNLSTTLAKQGFRVVGQFTKNRKRELSIPAFGLCSYAAAYCGDEEVVPVAARGMVEIPGVDFVVYKYGACVELESSRGRARIERRDDSYRYVNTKGDPLELEATISLLRDEGMLDQHGFAADSVLFEHTKAHRYPDPLANIYASLFTPRVKQTADILISLHDGFYYGWSPFGRFVRLAATHGNALQSSSHAFLMSTHRQLPEYVRADHAKVLLKA